MGVDNTQRFTSRVDTYVKYRPSYPKEAINYLYEVVGFTSNATIADIGAGTGIFTKLLLDRGSKVTAVEPNHAMGEAAKSSLGGNPNFHLAGGTAEHTGLADHSIDFIVCAQAFHWFDRAAAQIEFRRILKPGGKVVLIWNSRLTEGTAFLVEYEQLFHTFGINYVQVNHRNISSDTLSHFFKEGDLHKEQFAIEQQFDFEGLRGRLSSSSYTPTPEHLSYEAMMAELRSLFNRNEQQGIVSIAYETEVYWGEV